MRLEPPYLIALLVAFTGIIVLEGKPFHVFLPHLVSSAFYLHNVIVDTPSWVLGVAWSLEVEAQFYLLMPMLASWLFTADRRARRTRIALLMVAGGSLSQVYLDGLEARGCGCRR